MIKLQIKSADGKVLAEAAGTYASCVYRQKYNDGDYIELTCDSEFVVMKLASHLADSIVYLPEKSFRYDIPKGDKRRIYAPNTWDTDLNIVTVREASDDEAYGYRNIAQNSAAVRFEDKYFPFARANHVTRDEVTFEERNSIDGIICQDSHGFWPFQSYAGGAREDIEYYLYFGRNVSVDTIIFYLRADFNNDHDTYWKSFDAEFSDGSKMSFSFEKSNSGQKFRLSEPKITSYIHLTNFKQASNPLSWAALSQIEVYGNYLPEK
ncbi:MAG: hypothetical protein J6N52_07930 [Clostridia bacterium]|nr:hypothetical protein [Clostridia bacterium]